MSQTRASFPPSVVAALTGLVEARAPKNRPMTLDEVEHAVMDVLRDLGEQVTEEAVAAQIAQAEKRGPGRGAADRIWTGRRRAGGSS